MQIYQGLNASFNDVPWVHFPKELVDPPWSPLARWVTLLLSWVGKARQSKARQYKAQIVEILTVVLCYLKLWWPGLVCHCMVHVGQPLITSGLVTYNNPYTKYCLWLRNTSPEESRVDPHEPYNDKLALVTRVFKSIRLQSKFQLSVPCFALPCIALPWPPRIIMRLPTWQEVTRVGQPILDSNSVMDMNSSHLVKAAIDLVLGLHKEFHMCYFGNY